MEIIVSIPIESTDLQREAKNSQAELDYVIQIQENIVPIEVKAGTKGSMQSLYLFMQEKKTFKKAFAFQWKIFQTWRKSLFFLCMERI